MEARASCMTPRTVWVIASPYQFPWLHSLLTPSLQLDGLDLETEAEEDRIDRRIPGSLCHFCTR
jgi:hypothetical protein